MTQKGVLHQPRDSPSEMVSWRGDPFTTGRRMRVTIWLGNNYHHC